MMMFLLFVGATLGVTYWAAQRTHSVADYYSAGGGIIGFQNGLAIAGDDMSVASFLGISGLVFMSGYDGLIYHFLPEKPRRSGRGCKRDLFVFYFGVLWFSMYSRTMAIGAPPQLPAK